MSVPPQGRLCDKAFAHVQVSCECGNARGGACRAEIIFTKCGAEAIAHAHRINAHVHLSENAEQQDPSYCTPSCCGFTASFYGWKRV